MTRVGERGGVSPPVTQQKRRVPKTALQAAVCACQFAESTDDAVETQTLRGSIKLTPSSGVPFAHPYWGRLVFDFAGMVHGQRVTLDYCHWPDEVIGYADEITTEGGRLTIAGELVARDDQDRAAEVLIKGRAGVPYEGSIKFDPWNQLTIEEIQAGMSAMVNGQQLEGPLTVVRTCLLRGVAVCPYGADPYTHSEFSEADAGEVDVHILTTEQNMGDQNQETKTAAEIRTELKAAHADFVTKYGAELAAKWGPLGEAELSIDSVSEYVKTLRDGHAAELATQKAEHDRIVGELTAARDGHQAAAAELQERLNAVQLGESSPASSRPGDTAADKRVNELSQHLKPGLARFAAGMKLPTAKAPAA